MKIILFFIAFLPLFGNSQLTDTTCIKSRWIALKPIPEHSDIFCLDTTILPEVDMIKVIQSLVENYQLNLYYQKLGSNGKSDWYQIDYATELAEAREDSSNSSNWRPYFTMYGPQSDQPLSDEYGEPLVRIGEQGYEEYVYPNREVFYIPTRIIDEIRIKENKVYNTSTEKYEFVPVGMSFYFEAGGNLQRGYELFWIDLDQLKEAFRSRGKEYPWYEAIMSKRYRGFQYMQVSCYDGKIKY